MNSITAGMSAERTNRWLLIGAAVLAVVAGVLVFVALANVGGDDEPSPEGDSRVYVATRTISANTKLDKNMFEEVSVPSGRIVPGAVQDLSAVDGVVTNSAILQGEQLTARRLSGVEDADDTLAPSIEPGYRGYAISVSEASIVSGFIVPGDRVDIVGVFKEKRGESEITRVETVLQNVLVLTVAQEPVEVAPVLGADGSEIPPEERGGGRVSDADPRPDARTVSLQLTPEQVQVVAAAQDDGDLSLSLRPLGEDAVTPLEETNLDDYGFVPPLPRP